MKPRVADASSDPLLNGDHACLLGQRVCPYALILPAHLVDVGFPEALNLCLQRV